MLFSDGDRIKLRFAQLVGMENDPFAVRRDMGVGFIFVIMLGHSHQQFRFKPAIALIKQRHSLVPGITFGSEKQAIRRTIEMHAGKLGRNWKTADSEGRHIHCG